MILHCDIWGQFHRAAKQGMLLSKYVLLSSIKWTTSQNAYILYESLAGDQINLLSKFFWQAILSAKQLYEIGPWLSVHTKCFFFFIS